MGARWEWVYRCECGVEGSEYRMRLYPCRGCRKDNGDDAGLEKLAVRYHTRLSLHWPFITNSVEYADKER